MSNNSASKSYNNCRSPLGALITSQERFFIFEEWNVIGRKEDAAVCIKDLSISRKHAVIRKRAADEFIICDVSSSGTYLNGGKLVKNREYKLHHKDVISFSNPSKSYVFFINKNINNTPETTSERLSSQMHEQILDLDITHTEEIQKLNCELNKIETEKSGLKEEMSSRLQAQETIFKAERMTLNNMLNFTKEEKDRAETKLKVMEKQFETEKKELMDGIESRLCTMSKKEEELQQLKTEMELKHLKEKEELELKCQAEIEELKIQLDMSKIKEDQLQQESRMAKQKLEKSEEILKESELEQNRLVTEKIEVETKLETIQKEKEDLKEEMERKEREQAVRQKGIAEGLEDCLSCSICVELLVEATMLNCGHAFCKFCIGQWQKKKNICPMCRAKISKLVPAFILDSLIDRNVSMMSSEAKTHRQEVLNARKRGAQNTPKSSKRKNRNQTPLAMTPYVAAAAPHLPNRARSTPVPVTSVAIGGNPTSTATPSTSATITLPEPHPPRVVYNQVDLSDPFAWRGPFRRQAPSTVTGPPVVIDDPTPVSALPNGTTIDLTNVLDVPNQRAGNAPGTSGLIDLTRTP